MGAVVGVMLNISVGILVGDVDDEMLGIVDGSVDGRFDEIKLGLSLEILLKGSEGLIVDDKIVDS